MTIEHTADAIATYPSRSRPPQIRETAGRSRAPLKKHERRTLDTGAVVRALGWFSVGLGAAELLFPRTVNRIAGLSSDRTPLTRIFGLRELASGIGILKSSNPEPWIKARVAGDGLDLAVLGLALLSPRNHRVRTTLSIAAVAGVTALDVMASRELERQRTAEPGKFAYGVPIEMTLAVNRSAQECYDFWRKLENLPRFMRHLQSVTKLDEQRSHWIAKAPVGMQVEWDSQITEDEPGARLAWRSLPGSQIPNGGSVRFEQSSAGRGTLVVVSLMYDPPGGPMAARLARLLGEEPRVQIREDLRRFKQLIETGEIPTTRGQPSGRRSRIARMFGKGETP